MRHRSIADPPRRCFAVQPPRGFTGAAGPDGRGQAWDVDGDEISDHYIDRRVPSSQGALARVALGGTRSAAGVLGIGREDEAHPHFDAGRGVFAEGELVGAFGDDVQARAEAPRVLLRAQAGAMVDDDDLQRPVVDIGPHADRVLAAVRVTLGVPDGVGERLGEGQCDAAVQVLVGAVLCAKASIQ